MPKLRLMWPVDTAGYRIEPGAAPLKEPAFEAGKAIRASEATKRKWRKDHAASLGIIGSGRSEPMVVGISGNLIVKDALSHDGLCHELASTPRTKQGVLNFVRKHGLLTHVGGDSEPLEDFYVAIAIAKRLVKMYDAKPRNYNGLEEWMAVNGEKIRLRAEMQYPESGGPPQLFFRPQTLWDAIWLQFFQYITNGTQLRSCKRPGCPNWVTYGAGHQPAKHRRVLQQEMFERSFLSNAQGGK